jgi:hypothetical protein
MSGNPDEDDLGMGKNPDEPDDDDEGQVMNPTVYNEKQPSHEE